MVGTEQNFNWHVTAPLQDPSYPSAIVLSSDLVVCSKRAYGWITTQLDIYSRK